MYFFEEFVSHITCFIFTKNYIEHLIDKTPSMVKSICIHSFYASNARNEFNICLVNLDLTVSLNEEIFALHVLCMQNVQWTLL